MPERPETPPRSPQGFCIHEDQVEWQEIRRGERQVRRRRLAASLADEEAGVAGGLGCSMFEIAPGKHGWPYHFHTGNEEALYVLAGRATLRLGGERIELRAGHFASFPVGPDGAHALENTGDEPFRYLCFSTQRTPDITLYPDSGKVALFVGAAPGGDPARRTLAGVFRRADAVDYWEGEELPSPEA